MIKLLAGYFKAREGFSLLGDERGFITFRNQENGTFYIRDLYVDPDFRKSGIASEMANQVASIAKEAGAAKLIGSVSDSDPEKDRNIKVLHAYGMKFTGFNPHLQILIFEKDI